MKYGAFSEIGKLRKVLVCRPGLAHKRLTPGNCKDLLFDDVIWVTEGQSQHRDFVAKMQERGVEVLEMHDLLAKTLEDKEARTWVLDRRITEFKIGLGMLKDIRAWLDEMPARELAEHLIGGVAMSELPFEPYGMMGNYLEPTDFVVTPLPNTLFTRDTTCWIENGVTLNPMFWPARRNETLLTAAIYKFHPDFKNAEFHVWWGDPDVDYQRATVEGGDVMPMGNGVVFFGMGERTTPQGVGQIVRSLFQHGRRPWRSAPRCRGAARPCTWIPCSRCATATSAPSFRGWSTRSRPTRRAAATRRARSTSAPRTGRSWRSLPKPSA